MLLDENRILVLALAHAMEAHKTVSGDDVAAIIEGTMGPIIDGRIYHDPEFQAQLEEYHVAALRAHQRVGKVEMLLPGRARSPTTTGYPSPP